MKRTTFYAVDFNGDTKYFERKRRAFRFAAHCGDSDWTINRYTALGTGVRAGLSRRSWKKARITFYFADGTILQGKNYPGISIERLWAQMEKANSTS